MICQQNSSFSFSSGGDEAGTATFTFLVTSGQPVNVQTQMKAWGYSDPFITTPVTYDFSHTATLSSISTCSRTPTSALRSRATWWQPMAA